MMVNRFAMLAIGVFFGFAAGPAKANDVEVFLRSCAYGTAAGALVGLATVAVSEDPSSHRGNIARGASLGLYAGLGFGLYTLYGPRKSYEDFSKLEFLPPKRLPLVWFSPLTHEQALEGAQIHWMMGSFK